MPSFFNGIFGHKPTYGEPEMSVMYEEYIQESIICFFIYIVTDESMTYTFASQSGKNIV